MKLSFLVAVIFVATAFSGCIESEKENGSIDNQNEALMGENCINFENLERCWEIYAPLGIDPTTCLTISCPIIVDIHQD